VRKDLVSRDTKGAPLSLCTQPGKPNKQKGNDRHCVTVKRYDSRHCVTVDECQSPLPAQTQSTPAETQIPLLKTFWRRSDCVVPRLSEFTPVFVSVWQQWVCDIPGAHLQGSKTRNRQDIRAEPQLISTVVTCAQGWIQGGRLGRSLPPKTYESNFFHHDFEQFGKQHSRYKAILPSIVLSQQCREAYFIFFTVVNP